MRWTPDATIRSALWIGGGQWAGKTTVSFLLTERYELVHYPFDYYDVRTHQDRRVAKLARAGAPIAEPDWERYWVEQDPAETARGTLEGFQEQFPWVLDDIRGLLSTRPVLAEGWGLRPSLVASVVDDPRRMVVMVPTDEWREHQAATLPRANAVSAPTSDPVRAQRNRLERDRLLAVDAANSARRLGIRVIEVDGSRGAGEIAEEVAEQFRPFLRHEAASSNTSLTAH